MSLTRVSHRSPALTLFVLGYGDVVLPGGVQHPKEGVEVVAAEQTRGRAAAPLGRLQPLQLLHQERPRVLWNTHAYTQ